MERRVGLNAINPHMLCVLCGGYFIDATTIVECVHTFCRSCIVKHLEHNKFCPICDVQLHKNGPLLSIRPDKQMQRLVYKMVEGLHRNECERRKHFYQTQEVTSEKVLCDKVKDLDRVANYLPFNKEDLISLSLEYYDDSARTGAGKDNTNIDDAGTESVNRRFLRCPAGIYVRHIKQFLLKKYQLSRDHQVDVYYKHSWLRDNLTLSDVADLYDYDRINPMRLFFQLLEYQPVTMKNPSHVIVAESPPSKSIEASSAPPTHHKTGTSTEQTGPSCSVVLGKKKLRDFPNVESVSKPKKLRFEDREAERYVQMGKLRSSRHVPLGSQTPRRTSDVQTQDIEEVVKSANNSSSEIKSAQSGKYATKVYSPEPRDESTEDTEVMDVDIVRQTADSLENQVPKAQDASQDIEEVVVDIEGESSQEEHFILQEDQQIDISEDLEEDDDEDRLRICDPEEVAEDRNGPDSLDENVETEPVQNEENQAESFVEEEEVEVVRKESKSRRKNKKAKHHHRHKRDYSPAPEATIVPVDKNDIMKLKLKLTRPDSDSNGMPKNKQEDNSKSVKNNDQPKPLKQKPVVILDDTDNNSVKSLNNSNLDEDSRNSQSTDDARSVSSSKEGQEEAVSPRKETPPNGSLKQLKAKNVQFSNKAKLFQMRQVRHKNITPSPRNTNNTTTITKVTSEEASRNSPKSPIVLSSPNSSLTVSKVTAEERLKMMTNNNLESTQPSLEIIPVNKSSMPSKNSESKTLENQFKNKNITIDSPVVRLIKTNNLNAANKQSLTTTKINNNNESPKNTKDDRSKPRPGERKPESFGVLDLSKPARSTSSSPAAEGTCPSPSQTTLSLTQPIIKRHVSSINSPHRNSTDSPPVPKGSPNRPIQYSHPMYNLSVLTNAAVHIENKTQLAQEAIKRQQLINQKVSAPLQRYPGMSPTKTPVSRASPTQLKIPNPNMTLHNKFLNRPKLPISGSASLQNTVRPTRPLPSANVRPNNNFGGNMLSQSAAVAKKQAGINGRPNIPPPPAGIPISELYKMPQKYDLEKIARKLKGQARIPSS